VQHGTKISVGMGTLAGSTVMLLTIVWGGSVLLGRCDLDDVTGAQRDRTRTRPWFDLVNTGVSTDAATPRSAWAMLAAAGLFVVVQVCVGGAGGVRRERRVRQGRAAGILVVVQLGGRPGEVGRGV
jgi:hypothetical protein